MDKSQIMTRTKHFALSIIKLTESLPRTQASRVIGRQLLRAATSVGANYRAACQARSKADFISKLGIVAEEADETQYWMELLLESNICNAATIAGPIKEAKEITAIIVASLKTARNAGKI